MFKFSSHRAFTLVELLVVVSLIAVLSVSVMSIINPGEQNKKAFDARIKTLISEIFKAHLRYSQYGEGKYLPTPVVASKINSPESRAFLDTLVSSGELKNDIISDKNMDRILLTTDSLENVALCFLPQAKSNQVFSDDTRYDSEGYLRSDCDDKLCYYCLASDSDTRNLDARITVIPTPTSSPCSIYSRAYPNFPFTTDFADKHTDLCTNFSIHDRGCDTSCPSGQRHLVKSYYSVPNNPGCNFIEDYCVSEPYANCLNHPLPSSDLDFNWGCRDIPSIGNPQRPYSWK